MCVFELIKKDGSKVALQAVTPFRDVLSAAESARWQEVGEVVLKIASRTKLSEVITISDVLLVYGEPYVVDELPAYTFDGALYIYTLTLKSAAQLLNNVQYYDTDVHLNYVAKSPVIHNDLRGFAQVIVNNMCRVYGAGTWVLGSCIESDTKTIVFSGHSCLNTVAEICAAWSTYYTISYASGVFTLHIGEDLPACSIIFHVGAQKGLFSLKRESAGVGVKNIVTVLGGRENLPYDYTGIDGRLTLPLDTYPASEVRDEASIAKIGPREGLMVYEEIFPTYTGTVTSIGDTPEVFFDTGINFDVQGRGAGVAVMFKTGALAGIEIEVAGFDPELKKFTLLPSTDSMDMTFPGTDPYIIEKGDKYVLKGIVAQPSHIAAARAALLAQAMKDLPALFNPPVEYTLTLEPSGLKREDVVPTLGQPLVVFDPETGQDEQIRLVAYKRDLLLSEYDLKDLEVTDAAVNLISGSTVAQLSKVSSTLENFGIGNMPDGIIKDLYTLLNTIAERLGARSWKHLKDGGYKYDPDTGKMRHKWLDVDSLAADDAYIDQLTVRFLETVGDAKGYKVTIENSLNEEGGGASAVSLSDGQGNYAEMVYSDADEDKVPIVKVVSALKHCSSKLYPLGLLAESLANSPLGYAGYSIFAPYGVIVGTGTPAAGTVRLALIWNPDRGKAIIYNDLLPWQKGEAAQKELYRDSDGLNNPVIRHKS